MADILNFPIKDKKDDDALIEEHRTKLMILYAQRDHVLKEIHYHKEVLKLLEKGIKKADE